ncbi:Periplasmic beta-glucosidase precursor [Brevundimonas sp. SH203]|uniref:beta-glucosidase BglX n=1 Tax=Brevundimonas sp. SH203 TaxID=345167 RepID=UPI0009C5BBA7|nr:beta-glucosidase BglX [Brevundimonas sp. SH203]GAW40959.1 Periplasmic beta-glucosidase precursor [Brevundimonas sp. SH203]
MRPTLLQRLLVGVAVVALTTTSAVSAPTSEAAPTVASVASPEARAEALIARMTVEEKVGQVSQQFVLGSAGPVEARVRAGQLGSLLFVRDPVVANRLQRMAVEDTRLGIPLLFGYDVVHGLRTVFPVPLGMAATWNPTLVEQSQSVAATEARAVGIHWTFAPALDMTRDPRWGRIVEGPGEDPYLASVLARAQVRGFQGERLGQPGRIIAGPKHFLGYGASEGGRDYDSVNLSDNQIHNLYLPPFRAAVDAGAANIMSAYMEFNDVPAVANRGLLNDLLRRELGFDGFVVSDANAVRSLIPQHFATDATNAAIRSIRAGNDMEMAMGAGAYDNLAAAVRDGKLDEAVLDRAVRRILIAKFRMGLFENPYVDASQAESVLQAPDHRRVARQAAEQAMVLLQNRDGLLPLQRGAHQRVAVIGPMSDSLVDTVGPWSFADRPEDTITLFKGLKAKLEGVAQVETAPGVQLRRGTTSMFAIMRPMPPRWDAARAEAEYARALDLARRSDLVILTIGEDFYMSGEQASRASLSLPGDQQRLIDAVTALGKPVVMVMINGRPLDISKASQQVPAILEAWHPGSEGGAAIANVLYGDVNPGGKLPITWPRDVGQIPIYYAHNRTKDPATIDTRYWDQTSTPLFPFGFGLSYTDFQFSDITVDRPVVRADGAVVVSVVVANTGARAGDETVQLYIHQRAGRATRPVRELKGFQRISLAAGERRTLSFTLGEAELKYWSATERAWVVDPGVFDVWVGGDSRAELHTTFELQ